MSTVRQLYELQVVDLELDRDLSRLQAIIRALGDDAALRPLRDQVRVLTEESVQVRAHQKDLELAVAELAEHLERVEGRMYGGTVRSPRELENLQADVAQLGRQRRQREDSLLEVMERSDELTAALTRATNELQEREQAWTDEQAAMREEEAALRLRVAELAEQRERHVAAIPGADLSRYEQIRKGNDQGAAVTRVVGAVCQTCRVSLPSKLIGTARAGAELVRCDCPRGLFLLAE